MLRFEATVAFRHLRSGGGQTVLTISAVAVGVLVVVFITGLIFGVRERISSLITDLLPHVTITPREQEPTPLSALVRDRPTTNDQRPMTGSRTPSLVVGRSSLVGREAPLISSRIEKQSQQRKEIENWQQAVAVIREVKQVTAVAPAVTGQGFVSRGGQRIGVQVFGADPAAIDAVTAIEKYVYAGHYMGLDAEEILLSHKTAADLGVSVGDRVRLTSSEGLSDSFRIAGLFDTGQDQSFGSRAYLTLRAAQSLFATGTAVRTILVTTNDIFAADQVADRIMALLPYKVESWSRQAPQAVAGLAAQRAVALIIAGFSLMASAFAISSVLIVSVLQKSKQIGILKSMGAKGRQILLIFTLEALGIALVGSTLGAVLGSAVVWALGLAKQPVTRMGGAPESLLPARVSWQLIAAAMLAAILSTVLASILPARRAARLDPVQVMR